MLQGFKQNINSSDTEINLRKRNCVLCQTSPTADAAPGCRCGGPLPSNCHADEGSHHFNMKHTIYSKEGNLIDLS